MNDIDWMDVKEKDDTIREYRRKLTEAYNHIAELIEGTNKHLENNAALTQRIAELELSEEKYRLNAMDLEEKLEEKDKRIAELEETIDLHVSNFAQLLEKSSKRIAELEEKIGKLYLEKYA